MIERTLIPIIEKRFYYLADINPPKDVKDAFFFNVDDDLAYQPYYEDFGPVNIAKIWKYVNEVSKILNSVEYKKNIFYHYCSPKHQKCTNAALLVCAYQIIMMNKTAQQAYLPFQSIKFKSFRDASYGTCSYKCTILDCLKGLEYGIKIKWFDFEKFDLLSFQHYEQIQNGDLNWVVPGKLAAFSSPHDEQFDKYGHRLMSPKDYLPVFKKLGINTVVRLNSPTYDRRGFLQNGVEHHDLYFPDGSTPSLQIVQQFLDIVENAKGGVAVHCKAGLGRTGTLIACYAMKHFKFFAAPLIGWIRLCRPGSVLGPQQYFLLQIEQQMHKDSENSPVWKSIEEKIDQQQLQKIHQQMKKISLKQCRISEKQKEISKKGDTGQGKRLLEARKKQSFRSNGKY